MRISVLRDAAGRHLLGGGAATGFPLGGLAGWGGGQELLLLRMLVVLRH